MPFVPAFFRPFEFARGLPSNIQSVLMRFRALVVFLAVMTAWATDLTGELRKAVRAGDVAQVRELLESGAAVNGATPLGGTPLHDAVWAGDEPMTALLLSFGADVNAR